MSWKSSSLVQKKLLCPSIRREGGRNLAPHPDTPWHTEPEAEPLKRLIGRLVRERFLYGLLPTAIKTDTFKKLEPLIHLPVECYCWGKCLT